MESIIKEYEDETSWRLKENANFNKSFTGEQAYISNRVLARHALKIMPDDIANAHLNGDLHLHNLDSGMKVPYCHGGALMSLLLRGIRTKDIAAGPAKHLDTVMDHIVNYFFMSQLEFSGAQAMSDFDTLVAPFVYYDKADFRTVKQNIQRLVYNLNFACRQAFQTPFTNLTFNLVCPSRMLNTPAIVGGKAVDRCYGDFDEESKMINKAFAGVLYERDVAGRPFTFPIPTLNLTKRIDFSDPVMEDIIKVASSLGSYYFMNYLGSGIDENTVRAMCCRLNLDLSELSEARGLWNMGDGTGSLGVVSINMSRIGYLAKDDSELFDLLVDRMELAKRQLLLKKKIIKESMGKGLMPFSSFFNLNLDHYFCTIGLIGLNEMMVNFTGAPLSANMELANKVLSYMREVIRDFQRESGELFNLEETPGEGSSYKLAVADRSRYPEIFTQGTMERPYYTTLLVPPNEGISLGKRLEVESKLLPIFTGGTVFRVYLGESKPDREAMLKFVERVARNYMVPYFDLTTTFSICQREGRFIPGVNEICHTCNGTTETFSRVVGYYRSTNKWNSGKKQEFSERRYLQPNRLNEALVYA